MGLVTDTDVWVLAERSAGKLDLSRWSQYGGAYMSAVTASELLWAWSAPTRLLAPANFFYSFLRNGHEA